MHSRTKAQVTDQQLEEMLAIAGFIEYNEVTELTGGEFNLAFKIYTDNGNFIMKVAPSPETNTLTHEKGIMAVELWAYDQIRQKTEIIVPEIIHEGHEVIGNHWFVMTEMAGQLFCDTELTADQTYQWMYQFGQALAQIHAIKGENYGFRQLRPLATWQDAYYDFIFQLLADTEAQGNPWPDTARILRFIRKWEGALAEVQSPSLVHYDLFSNNVFSDQDGNFVGLIDTERCFFGDPYADFFAITYLGSVEENEGLVAGYNSVAEDKLVFTTNGRARIALARLMLGLVMFTEGTTRLATADPAHWDRKHLATQIIEYAMEEMTGYEVEV